MSSLKYLRSKIASVKSTQKITKSMELVAGTKLRKVEKIAKSEDIISSILEYEMNFIINSISITDKEKFNVFYTLEKLLDSKNFQILPKLLVAFTSESGLCGNFNQVIMKNLMLDAEILEKKGKEFLIVILGKKGYEILEYKYHSRLVHYWKISKYNSDFIDKLIAKLIFEMISDNKISDVVLYFYKFKNSLVQHFTKKRLLGFLTDEDQKLTTAHPVTKNIPYYEGTTIFKDLLIQYLFNIIKYSLIQNIASEEAIRRLVMENASNNAGDIAKDLYLIMNKKRQAIITTELTEIISGINALE